MSYASAEIRKVLSQFEGKQMLRGYIPCNLTRGGTANYYGGPNPERYNPMGISGVTVGTGVDLGQTDIPTLKKIGVCDETIEIVRPYVGKEKKMAVQALHNAPLTISKEVADELDMCMIDHHILIIANRYDRDAGKGAFEKLPWQAQAVITSILYQRGVNSPSKFKSTWQALVNRDWKKAARDFQTSALWNGYMSRRRAEGKILEQLC